MFFFTVKDCIVCEILNSVGGWYCFIKFVMCLELLSVFYVSGGLNDFYGVYSKLRDVIVIVS